MSVFVIQNKKYDTNKMEFLSEVRKQYIYNVMSRVFGETQYYNFTCKLYRSKKNNFLLTHEEGRYIYAEAITEGEAKMLLMRDNYKKYEDIWGEIEEA